MIGFPVAHSLSPILFRLLSERIGVDLDYHRLEVRPDDLIDFVKESRRDPEVVGWNVTLPHKERMLDIFTLRVSRLDSGVIRKGIVGWRRISARSL